MTTDNKKVFCERKKQDCDLVVRELEKLLTGPNSYGDLQVKVQAGRVVHVYRGEAVKP